MGDSYEENLLELYRRTQWNEERIKSLEARVKDLELKLSHGHGNDVEGLDEGLTRTEARAHVMELFRTHNRRLSVTKGGRAEGSGIILTAKAVSPPQGERLIVKFFYSRSYLRDGGDWRSWHTVKSPDIETELFDLYVFSVTHQRQYFNFIFTQQELREYVRAKAKDGRDLFHFYFWVSGTDAIEDRDGTVDVTRYLERWDLPSKLIQFGKGDVQ